MFVCYRLRQSQECRILCFLQAFLNYCKELVWIRGLFDDEVDPALQCKFLESLVLVRGKQCKLWNPHLMHNILRAFCFSAGLNSIFTSDALVHHAVARFDFFDRFQAGHHRHFVVDDDNCDQVLSFFKLLKILSAEVDDLLAGGEKVAVVNKAHALKHNLQRL